MWKTVYTGSLTAFLILFLLSCSAAYLSYSRNMFIGKELLKQKEYGKAEGYFQGALKDQRGAASLTYLAVTNYKMNNMNNAERLIKEAERIGVNDLCYLRTVGYKALVLLKKDKKEGLEALKFYIEYYKYLYPLMTVKDVEDIWKHGGTDMDKLEKLMEEQITWYEDEMEQFISTGTGFYGAIYGM
ncbi:MAG: hypothetical protein NTU90_07895 [Proteobacteria bacterium]|nr:hypothetical protein [Pseudomonadota bacterium]